MAEQSQSRQVIDFFSHVAPQMKVSKEMLDAAKDDVLNMYYLVCDQIYEFNTMPEISREDPFARSKTIERIYDCVSGLFTDVFNTQEFSFSDLVAPESRRVKFFLSELVNFYHFKCQRQRELDAVNAEIENRRREVEEEKMFEQSAVEKLEKAKQAQEDARRKKLEAHQKSSTLQKELSSLHERKAEVKRDLEAKTNLEKEQQERIVQLEQAISDAEEKGKRLDMNIVSSPDRIVSDIDGMKREAAEMEDKQARVEQELRNLERVIANHESAKRIIESLHDELKQLEHYKEKLAESRRSRDVEQSRLKEMEMKSRAVEMSIRDLRTNNETKLRKLRDQEQQDQRNVELARQQIEHLKTDEKDLKDRRVKARDDIRTGQQQLKEVERAIVELGENFDRSVQGLIDGEKRVEGAVEEQRVIVERALRQASGIFRLSGASEKKG